MNRKEKLLWWLFAIDVIVVVFYTIGNFSGQFPQLTSILKIVLLLIPASLLFLHSVWTMSFRRGLSFILLASAIGLIAEVSGLQTGTLFGAHYYYQKTALMIFSMPFSVPIYWAVFAYICYSVTNAFVFWLGKQKPSLEKSGLSTLVLMVILDGLFLVAIDLFMDPLEVKKGTWHWLASGPFFGIPTGNFVGWFVVAACITGAFRLFEYFHPGDAWKMDTRIFLLPVLGYGLIALSFAFNAITLQMLDLATIGLVLMLPTVAVNLYLFRTRRAEI